MYVHNNWIGTLKLMIETYERLEATYLTDVKPELSPVELNVCKNGIFFGKKPNSKKISKVIYVHQSKLCEKIPPKGPLKCFL